MDLAIKISSFLPVKYKYNSLSLIAGCGRGRAGFPPGGIGGNKEAEEEGEEGEEEGEEEAGGEDADYDASGQDSEP